MVNAINREGDHLFTLIVWLVITCIVIIFGWLITDIFTGGFGKLSWQFLSEMPENSGRAGGIASILVCTVVNIIIALLASIPLGLATAIWLNEYTRTTGIAKRMTRLSLDILAGVPSIVFGLFGNALFCIYLGLGFSMLSGGLTLACMILPIFISTAEAGLSKVPDEWRAGAAALGLSKAAILWQVLLPAAAPAINAGLMLSIGRAMAETAALIFTSGYVDRMPESAMDSGRTLAVHIYDLSMNVTGGDQAAYASSLVLIGLLLAINGIAMLFSDLVLNRRIVL